MKKLIPLVLMLAIFVIASCNNAEKKALEEKQESEIEKLDSLSGVLEQSKSELEALGEELKELDSLINDLDE